MSEENKKDKTIPDLPPDKDVRAGVKGIGADALPVKGGEIKPTAETDPISVTTTDPLAQKTP